MSCDMEKEEVCVPRKQIAGDPFAALLLPGSRVDPFPSLKSDRRLSPAGLSQPATNTCRAIEKYLRGETYLWATQSFA